jgi:CBS domain containing-hemolysin-like protein
MLELGIVVALVIIASAICSGTEAALFSLRISKARELAKRSNNGKVLANIKENPDRPTSAIVIFNNVANIVGTFYITVLATKHLSVATQAWFPWLLTAAIILFSELMPKMLGVRHAATISSAMARPLYLTTILMTPLVWLIEKMTVKLMGGTQPMRTNEDEIRLMTSVGEKCGAIEDDEAHMIHQVFQLNDRTAGDIMTPRTEVSYIRCLATLGEAKQQIAQSQHSRLIVVGETIDEVKGIVLKGAVLQAIVEGRPDNTTICDLCEDAQFVSQGMQADELLEFFKTSRRHLAVVTDRFNGVAGVVTIEDVIEVITGEIMDETDTHMDMREVALSNGLKRVKVHSA